MWHTSSVLRDRAGAAALSQQAFFIDWYTTTSLICLSWTLCSAEPYVIQSKLNHPLWLQPGEYTRLRIREKRPARASTTMDHRRAAGSKPASGSGVSSACVANQLP